MSVLQGDDYLGRPSLFVRLGLPEHMHDEPLAVIFRQVHVVNTPCSDELDTRGLIEHFK